MAAPYNDVSIESHADMFVIGSHFLRTSWLLVEVEIKIRILSWFRSTLTLHKNVY